MDQSQTEASNSIETYMTYQRRVKGAIKRDVSGREVVVDKVRPRDQEGFQVLGWYRARKPSVGNHASGRRAHRETFRFDDFARSDFVYPADHF